MEDEKLLELVQYYSLKELKKHLDATNKSKMKTLSIVFNPSDQDKVATEANKQLIPYKVEEYDCLKMFLDKEVVPTEINGYPLSIIGRVMKFSKMPICIGTDNICPISGVNCDDETCSPGAECNIS